MKKFITIAFIAILMSMMIQNISYADTTITKEMLNTSIQNIMNSAAEGSTAKVTDNEIIITSGSENYITQYNLENKPTFSTEMTFTKDMTYDEYSKETEKIISPYFGFLAIADMKGVEIMDSLVYMMMSLATSEAMVEMSDDQNYVDGISKIENSLSADIIITDELYELTMQEKIKSDDEYVIIAKLVVNAEKDFSKLKGYANTIGSEFENAFTNSLLGQSNTIVNSQIGQNNMIENNQQDDTVANIEAIPQSGRGFDLVDLLHIVIIIAIAVMFILFISGRRNKTKV